MTKTINGVSFTNIPDDLYGLGISDTIIQTNIQAAGHSNRGTYLEDTGENGNFYPLVHAIDIDWDGISIDNTTINNTSDLITWIKSIETSGGNGGSGDTITLANNTGRFDIGDAQYTTIATINEGTDNEKSIKLMAHKANINEDGYMSFKDYNILNPHYYLHRITTNDSGTIQCTIDGDVHFINSKEHAVSTIKIKDGYVEESRRLTEYYILVPSTNTTVSVVAGKANGGTSVTMPHVHIINTGSTALSGTSDYNLIKLTIRYMGDEEASSGNQHPHYLVEYSVVNDSISQMKATDF